MARPKEFDETRVLDAALEMFRARGYAATSFAELTSQLGVSRQSLYDTYGDKEELFLAALKRYMAQAEDCMRSQLSGAKPIRQEIAELFETLIVHHCANGSHGCLLVNSMIELAPNSAARALSAGHARRLEGLFASRFAASQRDGQIRADKDPVELARFFYHTMLGVAVAARGLDDGNALRQTGRLALRVLD